MTTGALSSSRDLQGMIAILFSLPTAHLFGLMTYAQEFANNYSAELYFALYLGGFRSRRPAERDLARANQSSARRKSAGVKAPGAARKLAARPGPQSAAASARSAEKRPTTATLAK